MPSKNDLSSLKKTADKPSILPSSNTNAPVITQTKAKTVKTGKVGRPQKDKSEKRSEKIQLSLTKAESDIVVEKAGLAGTATYLYAELKSAGVFD